MLSGSDRHDRMTQVLKHIDDIHEDERVVVHGQDSHSAC